MIKSDQTLSGVWLRIMLDRPSMQLGVSIINAISIYNYET